MRFEGHVKHCDTNQMCGPENIRYTKRDKGKVGGH